MNLGGGRGAGSMSLSGSDRTRKAGDAESDEFPVGLRVLVVDDDPTCLKILERMLITCRYDVTKCNRVDYALNELRSNKNGFDVVISDVHMPNMDGFKLLEYVGLEMDLPVIMMSADDSKNVVMKGVRHGACDYLTKPVRMDALKNIWQHVVRRKKSEWPELEPLDSKGQRRDANEENWRSSKRKGDDEEADDKDDYCGFKKQRVVWSIELHQQFVAAVNQLGVDKAVPKKILELMDVPGLTRENVASHLQKYRLCLRKITEEPHHLGGMTNSYMSVPSAAYGTMSPLGGMDLQTFTAYQPSLLGLPPMNLGLSMPIRQTNAFGFESSISRLSELQHLQQLNNANRQSYLLHGNSTAMDPKQLTNLYQYTEPLEMIPPQPRLSTRELVGTMPRNALAENIQGMPYTSVNPTPELSRLIQEDANLPKKRSREFDTDYGLFNELSQQKNQDWLDASSNIGGVQHKSPIGMGNINSASTSVLADQNQGYSRISINGNKNMIASGPVVQEGINTQRGNNLVVEDVYSGVKPAEAAQEASSASNHYHFEFDQEDLLSVMLKQQEEVTGAVEGEFDFATLDDILSDRGGCIS